jgi:TATA-box binding protein (TBP) (component of TFIID and TFIIIB)
MSVSKRKKNPLIEMFCMWGEGEEKENVGKNMVFSVQIKSFFSVKRGGTKSRICDHFFPFWCGFVAKKVIMTSSADSRRGPMPASEPEVQNIVVTADFGATLNIRYLAEALKGNYNPTRFAAAILALSEPHCTGLFFSSGQVVCTGCKNILDAKVALFTFKNMFEQVLDVQLRLSQIQLCNIVCSRHLGYPVDLITLHMEAQITSDYEPQLFPGLHKHFPDLGTMAKVFPSGSAIITGAHKMHAMRQSFYRANKLFERYRMDYHRSHRESIALILAKSTYNQQTLFQNDKSATATSTLNDPNNLFANMPSLLPMPPMPPTNELYDGGGGGGPSDMIFEEVEESSGTVPMGTASPPPPPPTTMDLFEETKQQLDVAVRAPARKRSRLK